MNGLDLFSGIGGLTKALEDYVRPIAYCENDLYAQGVLLSRMSTGDLPIAPIWDDVATLHRNMLPPIDFIYGGFPCQDISVAGRRAGLVGKRSGLFFEIVRLAQEIKPKFIFLENVPNIRTKGLSRVVRELADSGYDCRWGALSATDVGANHKRERWFLLAYASGKSSPQENSSFSTIGKSGDTRANDGGSNGESISRDDWWLSEPSVGRVAHGVQFRVDRLRGLGNAVVPAQAREAFERLMGLK
jgi:DNA (cytosine-5)-methyltransferase 1